MKDKIIKILKIIAIIFLVFFITISIFQKIFNNKKGFLGMKIYVIASGSMEPMLHVGDVIFVYDVNKDKINVGDTIVYQGMEGNMSDKIITHRVENIATENNKKIFYTKGLANEIVDPAVYEEQVYGKYVCKFFIISLLSRIVRNPIGFIFLVFIPLVVLIVYETKDIIKEVKTRKKK